jgi:hypothetical protein
MKVNICTVLLSVKCLHVGRLTEFSNFWRNLSLSCRKGTASVKMQLLLTSHHAAVLCNSLGVLLPKGSALQHGSLPPWICSWEEILFVSGTISDGDHLDTEDVWSGNGLWNSVRRLVYRGPCGWVERDRTIPSSAIFFEAFSWCCPFHVWSVMF